MILWFGLSCWHSQKSIITNYHWQDHLKRKCCRNTISKVLENLYSMIRQAHLHSLLQMKVKPSKVSILNCTTLWRYRCPYHSFTGWSHKEMKDISASANQLKPDTCMYCTQINNHTVMTNFHSSKFSKSKQQWITSTQLQPQIITAFPSTIILGCIYPSIFQTTHISLI